MVVSEAMSQSLFLDLLVRQDSDRCDRVNLESIADDFCHTWICIEVNQAKQTISPAARFCKILVVLQLCP